ncbi:MAG: hypothetical protein AB7K71_19725 [Polyangiaceae bacterium]
MESSHTALFVVALVVGILLLQVLIWIPISAWMRKRSREQADALGRELEAKGEILVLGPESALYRGSNAGHGQAKGNSIIALTNKRLLIRRLLGSPIEVRCEEIAGVRESRWFLGAATGNMHLIFRLPGGGELGVMLIDKQRHAEWLQDLRTRFGEVSRVDA